MKTLTKETARSLAKVISSRLSTFHSDDLVAILGVGRESSNEEAVESWLISRFAEIDISHVDTIMEHVSEVLNQHLNDLRIEVAGGYIAELPQPLDFAQSMNGYEKTASGSIEASCYGPLQMSLLHG
jgi:hypothetical protein